MSLVEHFLQGERLQFGDYILYAIYDDALHSIGPENSDIQIRYLWCGLIKRTKYENSLHIRDNRILHSKILKKSVSVGRILPIGNK